MNKHPHEEVILAYYRGEQIEAWNGGLMEWREVKRYSGGSTTAPTFHPEAQYRIKPPTHAVELTQEEVETLLCLTARVGGQCENTARRHAESTDKKLMKLLPDQRKNRLYRWRTEQQMVEGEIRFLGDLPA